MSISAIIPRNCSAGHGSLWLFFFGFECWMLPAASGYRRGFSRWWQWENNSSTNRSLAHCLHNKLQGNNCKLILSSQQHPVTDRQEQARDEAQRILFRQKVVLIYPLTARVVKHWRKLWSLHPQRCSDPTWAEPSAACWKWPALARAGLHRSLPASSTLWFCD